MIENHRDRICINASELEENPIYQFHNWFIDAKSSDLTMPNAAILSTISKNSYPDSRTVMIKAYDDRGFIFFTDCKTNKVIQITKNQKVSLLFLWLEIERQIRISGIAEKITISEAFSYFSNRCDKIGCWIKENGFVNSRMLLENQLGELLKKLYKLGENFSDIFCGYRIVPKTFEFWQVCKNRLYQSFVYEKLDTTWKVAQKD